MQAGDIKLINTLIGDKLDKETSSLKGKAMTNEMRNTLKEKLSKDHCFLEEEEKKQLYHLMKSDVLDSIGNMALLSSGDNSAVSNGMFDYKRKVIVNRISNGSFVPKHTYDVFSKLITEGMNPDLTVWMKEDIEAHQNWMQTKISEILKKGKADESGKK